MSVSLTLGLRGGPFIAWRDEVAAGIEKHAGNPRAAAMVDRVMSGAKMGGLISLRHESGKIICYPSDLARSLLLEVRLWG